MNDAENQVREYYKFLWANKFQISKSKITSRLQNFFSFKDADIVLQNLKKYYCRNLISKTFLEVGAGAGKFCKYFHKNGYNIVGIDYDDNLVKIANNWCNEKVVRQANAYELPFPNSNFDVVLCHDVLEHIKYPRRAIHEMFRVCKHNGIIYIVTPNCIYPREPHYNIYPFPAIAPKIFGVLFLKLLQKNPDFFRNEVFPLSYFTVKNLIKDYSNENTTYFLEEIYSNHIVKEKSGLLLRLLYRLQYKLKLYGSVTVLIRKPLEKISNHYVFDKSNFVNPISDIKQTF